MSGYLVDTDVLSEAQKPTSNETAIEWLRKHEADLYTSAVVIGEIPWGIERGWCSGVPSSLRAIVGEDRWLRRSSWLARCRRHHPP